MDHGSIPMQQRHANGGEGRSGGGGGGAGGGGVTGNVSSTSACRASGARWTPTSEQIRILRELYYGCGIRSPNAEQIQRIAARLRQYGRIEGKNVFYWFQNHKARERQKKRLTTLDVNTSPSAAADVNHLAGVLSLSPSGAAAVASSAGNGGGSAVQLEASTNCWDSSTAMATERSFMQLQDYMGVRSVGGHHGGAGAGGAAPWACFPFAADQTPMTTTTATREPETLPLFPTGGGRHGGPGGGGGHGHQESVVHGGYLQSNFPCWGAAAGATTTMTVQQHHQLLQEQHSFYSSSNQLPSSQDAAGTSLELSLSSYCSPYPAGSM